jgi:drug/metabolite transporter (DMT)-like permease
MAARLRQAAGLIFDRPYILIILTTLIWAGNIVLARYIAGHVPPVAISFYRWVIAAAIMIPFAWPHLRRDWKLLCGAIPLMAVYAITGTAVPNTMAFYGLQYTQAVNALLIQSTGPLIIGLCSFLMFGDRLSLRQVIGILISLCGVVTIVSRADLHLLLNVAFNRGDLWVIGSLVIFAVYSALVRLRPAVHPISFLIFNTSLGAMMLAPVYALETASGNAVTFDLTTILAFAYTAIFASVLAMLFFNRAVELIGPNRTAPFLHLTPFFGSILAITLLGERLELFHIAGYALILVGVTVATLRR